MNTQILSFSVDEKRFLICQELHLIPTALLLAFLIGVLHEKTILRTAESMELSFGS
jgi:hypothetical protein